MVPFSLLIDVNFQKDFLTWKSISRSGPCSCSSKNHLYKQHRRQPRDSVRLFFRQDARRRVIQGTLPLTIRVKLTKHFLQSRWKLTSKARTLVARVDATLTNSKGLSHTKLICFQEVLRKFGSFNLTWYNGLEALGRVLVVAKHIWIPNVFETNIFIYYILPAKLKKTDNPSQDGWEDDLPYLSSLSCSVSLNILLVNTRSNPVRNRSGRVATRNQEPFQDELYDLIMVGIPMPQHAMIGSSPEPQWTCWTNKNDTNTYCFLSKSL